MLTFGQRLRDAAQALLPLVQTSNGNCTFPSTDSVASLAPLVFNTGFNQAINPAISAIKVRSAPPGRATR
jgi:hypothetical protein